jgi:sRNA-binding carbon storage regulator CsrA
MLVLTRAVLADRQGRNQVVLTLPDGRSVRVWLFLRDPGGQGVKVGIEAPTDVSVARGELAPPEPEPYKWVAPHLRSGNGSDR